MCPAHHLGLSSADRYRAGQPCQAHPNRQIQLSTAPLSLSKQLMVHGDSSAQCPSALISRGILACLTIIAQSTVNTNFLLSHHLCLLSITCTVACIRLPAIYIPFPPAKGRPLWGIGQSSPKCCPSQSWMAEAQIPVCAFHGSQLSASWELWQRDHAAEPVLRGT